jgi:hypothetical protein
MPKNKAKNATKEQLDRGHQLYYSPKQEVVPCWTAITVPYLPDCAQGTAQFCFIAAVFSPAPTAAVQAVTIEPVGSTLIATRCG